MYGRGEAEIEIGGMPRLFRWSARQIAQFEEKMKIGVMHALSEEQIGIRTIATALWVGYLKQDPKLTTDTILDEWIPGWQGTFEDLSTKVIKGIMSGMPGKEFAQKDEELADKPTPLPKREMAESTGGASSAPPTKSASTLATFGT